jgi:hypothetical protein
MPSLAFQPLVIIGAPRSGTNMLRNALTQLPGFATWPCDEINSIWRRCTANFPNDELSPAHATPQVVGYIRAAFIKLAERSQAHWVVEKTCANSLRVEYVREVLPEAKFIFLVRDGRDVVASALKRWHAKLDIRYTLRKAKYVPWSDVPCYAARFCRNYMRRFATPDRRLTTWGPRFAGMDKLLATCNLAEVCAEQWRVCIERAATSLENTSARFITVRYEDFVQHPEPEFGRITDFLDMPGSHTCAQALTRQITDKSVGNWRRELDAAQLSLIMPRIQTALARWKYEDESTNGSDRNPTRKQGRSAPPLHRIVI